MIELSANGSSIRASIASIAANSSGRPTLRISWRSPNASATALDRAVAAYREALPNQAAIDGLGRLVEDPYRLANAFLQAGMATRALEALFFVSWSATHLNGLKNVIVKVWPNSMFMNRIGRMVVLKRDYESQMASLQIQIEREREAGFSVDMPPQRMIEQAPPPAHSDESESTRVTKA